MKYKEHNPDISKEAFVLGNAVVVGNVTLHEYVSVWFNSTVRGDMACIEIGEGTNIQDNAVVHTDSNLPTKIGKFVTVGHSAIIHAATVKDFALIGMGSVILNGATVEEYAMVAAGTIVPPGKTVPARMLALGNPMRIIRPLTEVEIQSNIINAKKYIDLAKDYHNE
ncbi:MAG: gamma carbonic anhydrase family protein [Tenericutes bacterium]|nr:gamma carbonic anhydrase family protein [Mycoplasmatota bacterium]